jgi:hypothetical protein
LFLSSPAGYSAHNLLTLVVSSPKLQNIRALTYLIVQKAFGEALQRPFSTAYHAAADSEGNIAQRALEGACLIYCSRKEKKETCIFRSIKE